MMSGLFEHFEKHLGHVVSGWSKDAEGKKLPFQVAVFQRSPIAGAQVLATLGLSDVPLRVGGTGRRLRQELVMMFRESEGPRNLPGILQQVGLEALVKDQAYAVGDILGPRGELRTGSTLEALYVATPVYLPDSFQVFRPETGDGIVIGWLVPISASEARFAHANGRASFEEELGKANPDLLDFNRSPIV
jgi:hypothetical protein